MQTFIFLNAALVTSLVISSAEDDASSNLYIIGKLSTNQFQERYFYTAFLHYYCAVHIDNIFHLPD